MFLQLVENALQTLQHLLSCAVLVPARRCELRRQWSPIWHRHLPCLNITHCQPPRVQLYTCLTPSPVSSVESHGEWVPKSRLSTAADVYSLRASPAAGVVVVTGNGDRYLSS